MLGTHHKRRRLDFVGGDYRRANLWPFERNERDVTLALFDAGMYPREAQTGNDAQAAA